MANRVTPDTAEYRIASAFASAFVVNTRTDGKHFVKLAEGSPQWMPDAIYEAHGVMLPDDYVYATARRVVDAIAERLEFGEDVEDVRPEIVDSLVDTYTSDLTMWLNSHVYRVGYCDEMLGELGGNDGYDMSNRIALGQSWEIDQIFSAIWSAIAAQANEAEDSQ